MTGGSSRPWATDGDGGIHAGDIDQHGHTLIGEFFKDGDAEACVALVNAAEDMARAAADVLAYCDSLCIGNAATERLRLLVAKVKEGPTHA